MKKVKIISDGTAPGTTVFDGEGNKISGCVTAIEWRIDAEKGVGEAKITFHDVEVELVGEKQNG